MAVRKSAKGKRSFLNFMRFTLTESAAATFTELVLETNLSAERGMIMNIHMIEAHWAIGNFTNLGEVAAAGQENVQFHLANDTKSAINPFNDSDTIISDAMQLVRGPTIGTDAGPLAFFSPSSHKSYMFPLPIPYVKSQMYLGILGTDATVAASISGRIGYTLEVVSKEEFLSLLVALQ